MNPITITTQINHQLHTHLVKNWRTTTIGIVLAFISVAAKSAGEPITSQKVLLPALAAAIGILAKDANEPQPQQESTSSTDAPSQPKAGE